MKKISIFVTVTIFVMLFGVFAFVHKPTYYRLYPFDRITGTYSIEVDGKQVKAIDEYYEYENEERAKLKNDTKNFQIHDGDYGMQSIGFVLNRDELYDITQDPYFLEREDIELAIVYLNTNWWHVTNMDIEIDMIEENDEWYVLCSVDYTHPTEEGTLTAQNVSKKTKLEDMKNPEIVFFEI